jgi:hypothetical protein
MQATVVDLLPRVLAKADIGVDNFLWFVAIAAASDLSNGHRLVMVVDSVMENGRWKVAEYNQALA